MIQMMAANEISVDAFADRLTAAPITKRLNLGLTDAVMLCGHDGQCSEVLIDAAGRYLSITPRRATQLHQIAA